MDVVKTLRELYLEKKRLDSAIAALETRLRSSGKVKGRRGRKSMSAAERLEVSKRMKSYWQSRRERSAQTSAHPPEAPQPNHYETRSSAAL